jgi:proline iminopeptidase
MLRGILSKNNSQQRPGCGPVRKVKTMGDVLGVGMISRVRMTSCCAALLAVAGLVGCAPDKPPSPEIVVEQEVVAHDEPAADGVRMIPIETPDGTFNVWTKQVGDSPTMKVLVLHGGPGATHEYLEALGDFLPAAGIEIFYYDQLGSYFSDQPDDPSLWNIPRFVDEVEQVRQALGLGPENFFLYGHSWGGILAIEYALAHGDQLKGLIISNMMASIPAYNDYAQKVLMPQMDPAALAEIKALEAAGDYDSPRYMELLMEQYYVHHILRRPADQWPEGVVNAFDHINPKIYVLMQGPSELGASGLLADWDRSGDLPKIKVPTLVIGARYDTMDPAHMEWMAGQFPNGEYLYCPNGSHLALIDDQQTYMDGLIRFIRGVDEASR